jgi:hypothetical protein
MGCLGKGCLILALLILFLLVAGAIGIYYGMKRHSALAHAIVWAQSAHLLAQEPAPVPQFETTQENMQAAARKWHDFERAARRNEPAQVALTADDLNNLIARNPQVRGKVFVSVEDNRLHAQASVAMRDYIGYDGYYLNGEIIVQTDGPRALTRPPLTTITVNGRQLPSDLLGWKYRARPLSNYAEQYKAYLHVSTFEVRDGKLLLSTAEQ